MSRTARPRRPPWPQTSVPASPNSTGCSRQAFVTGRSSRSPPCERTGTYPPFDPGQLGEPLPAPAWEDFAPAPPSGIGKILGGAGRFERQLDSARTAYAQAAGQHTAAEAGRCRQLAAQRAAYDAAAAAFAAAAAEHNAGIDQFQRDCRAGDPEAVAEFCTLVMDSSLYPEGFPHHTRAVYRPDPKEAVIEWELPPQSVIPLDRDYRYVATRDAIDALPRAEKEIKERYRTVIAQVALRTIHEILVSTPGSVIELVTFYGYVSTKDPATGQPIRPLLLQVSATREVFSIFALSELDPVACLRRLNALVSPHPYDLEPVQPTVDFDSLLTRFKFVAGMDVVAGLDSRPDLLAMAPYEFEHLVRQIFEEMGMQAWNTQAIKDDGVDAVAVNNNAVFGGMCIIQAKRYRNAVGVEAIRALAGVMEDKHATKGILITTSWVTKDGTPSQTATAGSKSWNASTSNTSARNTGLGRPDQPPQATPALTSLGRSVRGWFGEADQDVEARCSLQRYLTCSRIP